MLDCSMYKSNNNIQQPKTHKGIVRFKFKIKKNCTVYE